MTKSIYIILSRTGTLLSKSIVKFGNMEYPHASLSLDPSLTEMYSFGRIYPKFPLWGGFVVENIYKGVYSNFKDSECIVMKIPVSRIQFERICLELNSFMKNKDKYHYNFVGLLGVKMGVPIPRKRAYFCSQFISSIIQKGGLLRTQENPSLISPDQLREIPGAVTVYQGLTRNYNRQSWDYLRDEKLYLLES